ncbi:MAG: PrsW family intramembrane metalloprotease [Spirochaetaceae bacterium]|nr:PrsW family intramembrane metalloprotease [Spirochaetaceae bacterium]
MSLTVIILSFTPTALISLYVMSGKKEKPKRALYFKLLIAGVFSVLPGVMIVTLATSYIGTSPISINIFRPFIAVALVEELIKLIVLRLMIYRNIHFRTIKDGMIFGVAIAVGFAFAENIIYMTGSTEHILLILSRSLTAVPLHAICGAFMGFYMGLGKVNENRYFGKALLASLTIHGLYNILINLNFPYYLLSIILLIFSLIILKQLYSKSMP